MIAAFISTQALNPSIALLLLLDHTSLHLFTVDTNTSTSAGPLQLSLNTLSQQLDQLYLILSTASRAFRV